MFLCDYLTSYQLHICSIISTKVQETSQGPFALLSASNVTMSREDNDLAVPVLLDSVVQGLKKSVKVGQVERLEQEIQELKVCLVEDTISHIENRNIVGDLRRTMTSGCFRKGEWKNWTGISSTFLLTPPAAASAASLTLLAPPT